jgi:Zn finger protein HypA/HybF involved in hydrogenase expression
MATTDPNQLLKSGFGCVTANPTVFSSSTLTTTAVRVTPVDSGVGTLTKVKISNLTAATNRLAYGLVPRGATLTVLTATPGTGICGVCLNVGQSEFITIDSNVWDIVLVGSAAATIVVVASYPVGV